MREPNEYEQFENFAAETPARQQAFIWWELRRLNGQMAKYIKAFEKLEPKVEELEGFMEAELARSKQRLQSGDRTLRTAVALIGAGQLLIALIVAAATLGGGT